MKTAGCSPATSALVNVLGRLRLHEVERARQILLHLFAVNDRIEEALLQKEFAALESFWEGLPNCLLDHARAGEADQRARFGDIQVAEHRVTGGHAAGGGIRED